MHSETVLPRARISKGPAVVGFPATYVLKRHKNRLTQVDRQGERELETRAIKSSSLSLCLQAR